jgi:hypothetical protein
MLYDMRKRKYFINKLANHVYDKDKIVYDSKQHVTKAYSGSGVKLHAFLTSILNGVEWCASRSALCTPTPTPDIRLNAPPKPVAERKVLSVVGIEPLLTLVASYFTDFE